MNITFSLRETGPERRIAEVELHFTDGPLAGLKLVGFSVWSGQEGEMFVTFPSRTFGVGSERRFFDFLRCEEPHDPAPAKALKALIIETWQAQAPKQAPGETTVAEGGWLKRA